MRVVTFGLVLVSVAALAVGEVAQETHEVASHDKLEAVGAHPPSELHETTTAASQADPQSDDTASRQATGKLGETVKRKGRRSSYHSRSVWRRRNNRRRGHNPGRRKVAEAALEEARATFAAEKEILMA